MPFKRTAFVALGSLLSLSMVHAQPPSTSANIATSTQISPVYTLCQRVASKLGSVNLPDCTQRQLVHDSGYSEEGTALVYQEFPPLKDVPVQAKVLLIGGIHGDEYSSVSIVYKWLKILERYHSGRFHWRIIPILNPDGMLRKKSQRMNANGVDLNRNFPTEGWLEKSRHYWVKRTYKNPRRYPGPTALSESESKWLVKQIDEFKPDVIVSVHAPHGILDFDGPREPPKRFGRLHLRLLGTYPGSLGHYAGVERDIPIITIELASAGIMPPTKEVSNIWTGLVRWLMRNATPNRSVAGENQAGPS